MIVFLLEWVVACGPPESVTDWSLWMASNMPDCRARLSDLIVFIVHFVVVAVISSAKWVLTLLFDPAITAFTLTGLGQVFPTLFHLANLATGAKHDSHVSCYSGYETQEPTSSSIACARRKRQGRCAQSDEVSCPVSLSDSQSTWGLFRPVVGQLVERGYRLSRRILSSCKRKRWPLTHSLGWSPESYLESVLPL